MGTRQIRIIIGIYCSHPAKICGFIHYDVLNMTVFVVLRSYVLECLVQLFVSLCLWCLKRGLGVVCKCFLAKNVIYVCGSFSCGFFVCQFTYRSPRTQGNQIVLNWPTSKQLGYPVYVNGTVYRDTVLRLNLRLGLTLFWYKRFYFSYENLAGQILVRLKRFRIKNRKCCIRARPTWPLITHSTTLNWTSELDWSRLSKLLS